MKIIALTSFMFLSLNCVAQNTATQSQFSLNLLAPSAEYELSISEKSTINMDLGVGFAYHYSSITGEDYGFFPGIQGQYRYYYNFEKRADQGKKTSGNSANYIAAVATITSGKPIFGNLEYDNDYGAFIGPAWGLQRVYASGFKLNLNLGLGLGFNDAGDTYLRPLFGLRLGWLLLK